MAYWKCSDSLSLSTIQIPVILLVLCSLPVRIHSTSSPSPSNKQTDKAMAGYLISNVNLVTQPPVVSGCSYGPCPHSMHRRWSPLYIGISLFAEGWRHERIDRIEPSPGIAQFCVQEAIQSQCGSCKGCDAVRVCRFTSGWKVINGKFK